jgi:flagellar hook assembly protein FlgD
VEELDGMIPCFVYPGDKIEVADDGNMLIHLFFLDDNDYGSSHSQQQGLNNGSTFQFATVHITTSDADEAEIAAPGIKIKNYPNPFNPQTAISFELAQTEMVNIDIYNIKGQRINTLSSQRYSAGEHSVIWNGNDDYGNRMPSGLYFYRIVTDSSSATAKMMLMK